MTISNDLDRNRSRASSTPSATSTGTAKQPAPTDRKAPVPKTGAAEKLRLQRDGMEVGAEATLRQRATDQLGAQGLTSAASNTAPRRELDPASVAAADADFDRIMSSGLGVREQTVDALKAHAGDSDYQAHFAERALKEGALLDYTINGGSRVPEADRQVVVDAVKAGIDAGTVSEQQIRDRAAQGVPGRGWSAVADELAVDAVGKTDAGQAALAEVRDARETYEAAHSEVQELDEKLGRELATIGKVLTPEERQKFVDAFRADPEHAEVYENEAEAREALAGSLEKNKDALLAEGVRDPAARDEVRKSLEAAADAGLGDVPLDYLDTIAADPQLSDAFADTSFSKVLEKAPGNYVNEHGGDGPPESVIASLVEKLEPLKAIYEAKEGVGKLDGALEALEAAARGDYDKLKVMGEEFAESSGLMKGLGMASIAVGALAAVSDVQKGDFTAAVKDIAFTGQAGAQMVAGAITSLTEAGRFARYAESAESFAKWADRFAPGLGLIANGAALGMDLQKGLKEGNAGYAVAALGDAIGVLGNAIEFVPGLGEVAGPIVTGIGTAIAVAGGFLAEHIEGGRLREDERRYLEAAGVDASQIEGLVGAAGEQVDQLLAQGYTASEIRELAAKYPDALTGNAWLGFQRLHDAGLSKDQVADLLARAEAAAPGFGAREALDALYGERDVMGQGDASRPWSLTDLQNAIGSSGVLGAGAIAALRWLEEQSIR